MNICEVIKTEKNKYKTTIHVINNNIYIRNIINEHIIPVIYEINKDDLFVDFHVSRIKDGHVTVFALFKHFLKDFGAPQKYVNIDVMFHDEKDNKKKVICTTNYNTHSIVSKKELTNCVLIPVEEIDMTCNLESDSHIYFESYIRVNSSFEFPDQIEKLAFIIVRKIMLRTKQFIEKMSL